MDTKQVLASVVALSTIAGVNSVDEFPFRELRGLWVGNEKMLSTSTGEIEPYCSRAIYHPPSLGSLFDWLPAEGFCPSNGIDPVKREINDAAHFLQQVWLPDHGYEVQSEGECIDADDDICDVMDILPSSLVDPHHFEGWDIEATSCGRTTKSTDQFRQLAPGQPGPAYCYLWQVMLMSRRRPIGKGNNSGKKGTKNLRYKKMSGGIEKMLVLTHTYGNAFFPAGEPNCPSKLMFRNGDLLGNDAGVIGAAQYVLVQAHPDENEDPIDLYDPCNWDCADKIAYDCE